MLFGESRLEPRMLHLFFFFLKATPRSNTDDPEMFLKLSKCDCHLEILSQYLWSPASVKKPEPSSSGRSEVD